MRVWWHCLVRMLARDEHRMVEAGILFTSTYKVQCSCGYGQDDLVLK